MRMALEEDIFQAGDSSQLAQVVPVEEALNLGQEALGGHLQSSKV